jgi:E3 ubiquitin-protein ligase RAD18
VQAFVSARSATLELARGNKLQPSAPKRKTAEEHHDSNGAPNGKRLRSSARLQKTQPTTPITEPTEDDEIIEVPDSDDDGEYQPEIGRFRILYRLRFKSNHLQTMVLWRVQSAKIE